MIFSKLLPLQGVFECNYISPGRCPGLGASALSGRADYTFLGVWGLPEFVLLL